MSSRVGPYEVVRPLVHAPGASLLEVRDLDGQRRVLQLLRLKTSENDAQRAQRQKEERLIAQKTAELVEQGEIVLHAHGASDVDTGERALFWILPWSDDPLVVDRAKAKPLAAQDLVRIGLQLAERMLMRHTWGRVDPLLSEAMIRMTDAGKVIVAGVPLVLPVAWLAPSMPHPRLAPEEIRTEDRRPSGDLWRLGRLLLQLAERSEPLPDATRRLFEELAEDEILRRILSAARAVEMLERCAKSPRVPSSGQPAAIVRAMSLPPVGGSTEPFADLLRARPDVSADVKLPDPALIAAWSSARDPAELFGPEAVTKKAEPETPVPKQNGVTIVDRTEAASASSIQSNPSHPALRAVALSTRSLETERVEPKTPIPEAPPVLIATDLPAERTLEDAPPPPRIAPPEEATISESEPKRAPLEAMAASWTQPVLPSGESPWSEVVVARGTHTRSRETFPGFSGDFPVLQLHERRPTSVSELDSLPSVQAYEPEASEIEVELAAALKGFNAKKAALFAIGFLAMFGLFALISRTGSADRTGPAVVSGTNEVVLESDPSGAEIIAEADGTVLGKAPLRFLVPVDTRAAVFLVAPGREPIRVLLPERGGITAKLAPLEVAECTVKLSSLERVAMEGVGFDLAPGAGDKKIPGAAVVRAKSGERFRGARLVTCPELGGQKEQELRFDRKAPAASVRISQPEGMSAFLNGDPVGTIPVNVETPNAFSRLQIQDAQGNTEERFVATVRNVEVRMALTKARPVPVLVAPDAADPLASDEALPEIIPEKPLPLGDAEIDSDAPHPIDPAKAKMTKAQKIIRAKALLKAGTKLLIAGRTQKAKDALTECIELDPQAAECHRNLGTLYRRVRATHRAREHFGRYLELAPDAPDAARIRRMLEQ